MVKLSVPLPSFCDKLYIKFLHIHNYSFIQRHHLRLLPAKKTIAFTLDNNLEPAGKCLRLLQLIEMGKSLRERFLNNILHQTPIT
ncbi:hypothetical protein D3C74_427640 [compost metagenome]